MCASARMQLSDSLYTHNYFAHRLLGGSTANWSVQLPWNDYAGIESQLTLAGEMHLWRIDGICRGVVREGLLRHRYNYVFETWLRRLYGPIIQENLSRAKQCGIWRIMLIIRIYSEIKLTFNIRCNSIIMQEYQWSNSFFKSMFNLLNLTDYVIENKIR